MRDLELTDQQAERLAPRIAEACIEGRADGTDVFAEQVNRALSARGIAAAVGVQHISHGIQRVNLRVREGG